MAKKKDPRRSVYTGYGEPAPGPYGSRPPSSGYRAGSQSNQFAGANPAGTPGAGIGRNALGLDPQGEWWTHPSAQAYVATNPGQDYNMPSWAQSAGINSPQGVVDYLGQYDPQTQQQINQGFGAQQAAHEQSLENFNQGESSIQRAIIDYQNSPAAQQLGKYAEPGYQAMSDAFVNTQRVAAGRSIAKNQADAVNAGMMLAGGRGAEGGGLNTQLQTAANFRAAGEQAGIESQLASDQLLYNTDFNKWATGQLSQRDANTSAMQERLGVYQSQEPVLYLDPNQFLGSNQVQEIIGSLDEAQQNYLTQIIPDLESDLKQYEQMLANAQTEEEEANATKFLLDLLSTISTAVAAFAPGLGT